MVRQAILSIMSVRDWLYSLYLDSSMWLPAVLIAVALIIIVKGLLKPPKV